MDAWSGSRMGMRAATVAALVLLLAALWLLPAGSGQFGAGGNRVAAATLFETTAGTTLLAYQARIANPATNLPLADGTYGVNFFLFDAATGGNQLWTEARSVQLERGLVTVYLGEVTPLPLTIFDGRDLWLQVQVNGEMLTGRQRLAWVAYAINARVAESVRDNTITSAKIVDGQVTSADIADGQVTSADIGDGQVTSVDIADGQVTSADIGDGQVTSADIGDGQVTSADIADGTIGPADLSPAAQNKFITLDIYAAFLSFSNNSAAMPTFSSAFGANGGIAIPEAASGAGSLTMNLTLPPNYTAGTPINGTIVWHASAGGCNIYFAPNSISVARVGSAHIVGGGASTGLSLASNVQATGTANVSRALPFTITSPVPANPLRAGDAISFSFFRNSSFAEDTCVATMMIQGVSLAYQ